MSMESSNTLIAVEDGFTEYESASKRQKCSSSKVWDKMTKLECNNKEETKAQCNRCKSILSAKASNGTSHLRRHLNTCLKKFNRDITQNTIVTQPNLGGGSSIRSPNFDESECRRAISAFLVCGKHSFRTVEEPGFKFLMSVVNPSFNNISRQTATRDVLSHYAKERDLVKQDMVRAPGRICLPSDNWKSEYTSDEYICLTAHWIDKDWKLQKRIIRFRSLCPPYDGLNIADELILSLAQWDIDNKIFSITLDNASYNDVMVSCLKNRFRGNQSLLCDGVFFQIRCCAHILNLIVQAGLKLADDVGNIRNGIRYIRKSGLRRKRFYDVAEKSFHLNVTRKLHQDVCVRWNSTYLMLESAIYYKDVLDYWGQRDKDFRNFILSDDQWKNVKILCDFLKVFYDVTCTFSGCKYPTANIYFRGVWKVHKHLVQIVKGSPSFLTPMVKQMQQKFDKYWAEYNLVLSCAAILDPRMKQKFVSYALTRIYENQATVDDLVQKILNNLKLLFDEYAKNSKSNPMPSPSVRSFSADSSIPQLGVNRNSTDDEDNNDYKEYLSQCNNKTEKTELDKYLEEQPLEVESDLDVLDYWSKSSVNFPMLSVLARDLLAIPISTVASESAFSMGKKVITPLRSSLKPKTVQAVVCLDDWLRAKGFSTEMTCEVSDSTDDENDDENEDTPQDL